MTENKYSITPLRDNPGIFYETIGEVRTVEIYWKMITYIDLTDIFDVLNKIQKKIDLTMQHCDTVGEICKAHKKQVVLSSSKLHKIVQYQNHILKLLENYRVKRAPFGFIGQISKILFGTMTTEDADQINSAIMHVENKTNDLAALLTKQTSATRIYFGELYNATSRIEARLSNLTQEFDRIGRRFFELNYSEQFEEIIESIDYALVEHEIDLNILIDGILFGKQGSIHPRIISPRLLIQNFKLIREQVPYAEFPIAINDREIEKLIAISQLQIAYAHNRLIYVLRIPLFTPEKYTLYKPIPLPVKQQFDKTKFAIIKPETEYIGLNEDAGGFYLFQDGEIRDCMTYDTTFICPTTFPLNKLRETPNCNIELLLNHRIKPNHCKIIIKELNSIYWKALTKPGTWIFSTPMEEAISIKCPNYIKQITIDNAGIITVQRGCRINTRAISMTHPSIRETEVSEYYIPINNLSILNLYQPVYEKNKIELTEATHELWQLNHSSVEATFDDIIKKAEQIKNKKMQLWRTAVHNALSYAIGLLSIFFAITYFFLLSPWGTYTLNQLCKRQKNRPPTMNLRQADMHPINTGEESPCAQLPAISDTNNSQVRPSDFTSDENH